MNIQVRLKVEFRVKGRTWWSRLKGEQHVLSADFVSENFDNLQAGETLWISIWNDGDKKGFPIDKIECNRETGGKADRFVSLYELGEDIFTPGADLEQVIQRFEQRIIPRLAKEGFTMPQRMQILDKLSPGKRSYMWRSADEKSPDLIFP